MEVFIFVSVVLLISFILALISMHDYEGERGYKKFQIEINKEKIKGGIVFHDKNKITHYSSNSS